MKSLNLLLLVPLFAIGAIKPNYLAYVPSQVNIELTKLELKDDGQITSSSSSYQDLATNTIEIECETSKKISALFLNGYFKKANFTTTYETSLPSSGLEASSYYNNSSDYNYVFVLDPYNKLQTVDVISKGQSLTQTNFDTYTSLLTVPPSYSFDNKYYDISNNQLISTSTSIEKDIVIKGNFKIDEDASTFKVSVCGENATINAGSSYVSSSNKTVDVNFDRYYTVHSAASNFSYWQIGEQIVSYNKTFTSSVYNDVIIQEVCNKSVTSTPLISLKPRSRSENLTKYQIVSFELPEGYSLVETGMIFNGTTFETADKKIIANNISPINEYAVKMDSAYSSCAAYLIYKDSLGNTNVTYSLPPLMDQLNFARVTGDGNTSFSGTSFNATYTSDVTLSNFTRIFVGNGSYRFASGKGAGTVTITAPTNYKIKGLGIKASLYGTDTNVPFTANEAEGNIPEAGYYSLSFEASKEVNFTIGSSSSKRAYLEGLDLFYEIDSSVIEGGDTSSASSSQTSSSIESSSVDSSSNSSLPTSSSSQVISSSSSSQITSDPYTNVNKTDFYANYTEASSYLDSYYRSLHSLMSGGIETPDQAPTYEPNRRKDNNGKYYRNTTATYTYSQDGTSYESYALKDVNGNTVKQIYYGGGYITLEDVAAYVYAFGDIPANHVTSKNTSPSSSTWGEYLRLNNSYFSCDTTNYPYEPVLPKSSGGQGADTSLRYYEMDVGTTGTDCDPGYTPAIYNNGTKITRGAARICYTREYTSDESMITDHSQRYVFYTYNHYNDFEEYLNYYQGWGEMFGNITGGGTISSKTDYNPTDYPTTAYLAF